MCCLTRGPTARVAAQLGLLRDVADEIVVALDSSVGAELAHPLLEVADVLVHYPYADPVDRPVGWIHSLCTRRLDPLDRRRRDPVAIAPRIGARRDRGSIRDPLLRAPPDALGRAETALVGPPWTPDFQLRLVANDSRLVWFPGITHWPIQAIGPHRYLETPLYHTDLLLNPTDRRRAKVRRYERGDPRAGGSPGCR